ncbi:MAG: hypothetical protein PSV35_09420 [bacterium]|nr:hypothetical protein [bacterium]
MKSKKTYLIRTTMLLSLSITSKLVAAHGNPASVSYVNQAIATAMTAIKTYVNQAIAAVPRVTEAQVNQSIAKATTAVETHVNQSIATATATIETQINQDILAAITLTEADWRSVCQSGDVNSINGCYGNAASQAFAKINRLGGNPLGYAGVTGNAANSVWVRQVGVGTSCTATDAPLSILNTAVNPNTTIWICGAELTNGSPVSSSAGLGALINNAAYTPSRPAGILFSTIAINNMSGGSTTQLTNNPLYFANSTILPTVYVFCISTTETSALTAFAQAPGTSLNSVQC